MIAPATVIGAPAAPAAATATGPSGWVASTSSGGAGACRPVLEPSANVVGDGGGGPPVWFRIDVGRLRNADPRWLIPVICARGGITKAEIGAIRVLPRETRFEIIGGAAEHFERNSDRPPKDHPDRTVRTARIGRAPMLDEPEASDRGPRRGPPPRRPGPGGHGPRPR